MELPKSVVLLGVSKDECYILDKTGRNESDIMSIFSQTLSIPTLVLFTLYQIYRGSYEGGGRSGNITEQRCLIENNLKSLGCLFTPLDEVLSVAGARNQRLQQ